MSQVPAQSAGWFPDRETGGTRYWDGWRWTGDSRPRRRFFAAPANYTGWGIACLVLFVGGIGSAISGPEEGAQSDTSPAAFAATSVLMAVAFLLLGIYLLRGRGPTTKSVRRRAASELMTQQFQAVTRPASGMPLPRGSAVPAATRDLDGDAVEKLQTLQRMVYSNLITEEEYQLQKRRILGL